jgi:hypothetical protein
MKMILITSAQINADQFSSLQKITSNRNFVVEVKFSFIRLLYLNFSCQSHNKIFLQLKNQNKDLAPKNKR